MQDFEIQPDQGHKQSERGEPLHVFWCATLTSLLDKVKVQHQVQSGNNHHEHAKADAQQSATVDKWYLYAESTEKNFEKSFPDKTAFVTADYHWNSRHNFSASFYYIDEMRWLSTSKVNVIKPVKKLDLRYAYIIDQRSETRIELIGRNLLEDYNDYTLDNLAEPIFQLRISGGF